MPANQSAGWMRAAPETTGAYKTCPAFVVNLGSPTTGTWGLNWHGQSIAGLSKTITAAALKIQLQTLTGLAASATPVQNAWEVACPDLSVTGSNGGPYTITMPGWQGQLALTAGTTAGGWDGTLVVTGGPVWTVFKVEKIEPPEEDTGIESKGEMRNSPDKNYDDSVTEGGGKCTVSFETGIRADQTPILCAMGGFTDTVTGSSPAYTHTMVPAALSTSRKTYAVQIYDGLVVYCVAGFVGNGGPEFKFGGGEKGDSDSVTLKGWGCPAKAVSDTITPSMPSNTTYKRMSPVTSGAAYTLNGSTFKTLQGAIKFEWDSNPLFAGRGAKAPDQPEYKFRKVEHEVEYVHNSITERDAAMTATSATRAAVLTCYGSEAVDTAVYDQMTITVPAVRHLKPKNTAGEGAPKATVSGVGMYNSGIAGPISITFVNGTAGSFSA